MSPEDPPTPHSNSSAYGEVFYGAEAIGEGASTGHLILEGRAWVRMGKAILDGREDPNSVIRFDKAAPKVVSKEGRFEVVTLLDSGEQKNPGGRPGFPS